MIIFVLKTAVEDGKYGLDFSGTFDGFKSINESLREVHCVKDDIEWQRDGWGWSARVISSCPGFTDYAILCRVEAYEVNKVGAVPTFKFHEGITDD